MKQVFKIFLISVIIFLVGEIIVRGFFPQFANRSVSVNADHHIIQGKKNFYKKITIDNKTTTIRDPKTKDSVIDYQYLIYIIGDSVTAGFGLSYKNTYYSITEDLLNIVGLKSKILPISQNGANLYTEMHEFKKFYTKTKDINKKEILIYQFGYNDLSPSYLHGRNTEFDNFGPETQSTFYKTIAINTAKFRYKYLNKSSLLSMLQFYIGKIRYKAWKSECLDRGNFALGEWTFAFKSKGFEERGDTVWKMFEEDLLNLKNFTKTNNIDLYVMISPISVQIPNHEEMNIYNYNLNCATIDPRTNLKKILDKNSIKYLDPTNRMIEYANNYSLEGNKEKFFFDMDYAHPNELGSTIIAKSFFQFLYNILR